MSTAGAPCPPDVGTDTRTDDCTCSSICRSVGKSNTNVSGSEMPPPSCCCSRQRSSVAPSESRPASISGASAATAVPISSCAIAGRMAPTSKLGCAITFACEAIACMAVPPSAASSCWSAALTGWLPPGGEASTGRSRYEL